MTGWSQIVAELASAGLSGDALVAACRRIERAAARENATVVENPAAPERPDGRMRDWADPHGLAARRDPMLLRFVFERDRRLSRCARAVGLAMIDGVFDRNSGRFPVAVTTLARKAGCNRATVFRALRTLESAGLVMRFSYAGIGHANAYQPLWDMFAQVAERVRAPVEPSQNATVGARPSRQPSQNATQTQRDIYNKPSLRGESQRRQPQMLLPTTFSDKPALPSVVPHHLLTETDLHSLPRRKAAERLWVAYNAMHGGKAALIRALQQIPTDQWRAGVDAEMLRAGKGLDALVAAMEASLARQTGTGPPD